MSHAVGEKVWLATTFVGFDGETRSHVVPAIVAAVIDGTVMVKFAASGAIRAVEKASETLCDSEAEAWALAARELTEARDRVQAAINDAVARAAGSRVGEAVPA
jgi:hypothetical protein